jgi:hypothetical protein
MSRSAIRRLGNIQIIAVLTLETPLLYHGGHVCFQNIYVDTSQGRADVYMFITCSADDVHVQATS